MQTRLARIALAEPAPVFVGSKDGFLIDLSLSGALVEHEGFLPVGALTAFHFQWSGRSVVIEAEVVRCALHGRKAKGGPPICRSGLAFRRHHGDSAATLREILTILVERSLERSGVGGCRETLMSGSYLRLTLTLGRWTRESTEDPRQPANGFTVPEDEDPEQVKLLCEMYQKLPKSDLGLVQRLAELRLAGNDGRSGRLPGFAGYAANAMSRSTITSPSLPS